MAVPVSPNPPKLLLAGWAPRLREAASTRAFWALWGAFFATSVGMYAVSLQSVTYMIENGMDPLDAATAFGVAGGLSIVGMLVTGIAADRWDRRGIAVRSYGLSMIGLLALFLLPQLPVAAAILVFVTCFGLSLGVRSPIIATLSAQLFRGRGLASIYGSIQTGQGVGAAVGTWIAGVLFDATGSYYAIFILSFAALLVAIALFWLVPEMRVTSTRNPSE